MNDEQDDAEEADPLARFVQGAGTEVVEPLRFLLDGVNRAFASFRENENEDEGCLVLHRLRLGTHTIEHLTGEWTTFRQEREFTRRGNNRQGGEWRALRSIRICYCSFPDPRAMEAFIRLLRVIGPELKELSFSYPLRRRANLDRACVALLLTGFVSADTIPGVNFLSLGALDLRGGGLGHSLQTFLGSRHCRVQRLRLWNCRIDENLFVGLVNGVRDHRSGLELLDISRWNLDDVQFERLVEALIDSSSDTHNTLQDLRVARQDITALSIPNVARIIVQCRALLALCLASCRSLLHGQPAAVALQGVAEGLVRNTTLVKLDLRKCGITDESAAPLFQALEQNITLRELDISSGSNASETVAARRESISASLAGSLARIRGLSILHANLDLQSPLLRHALQRNSSLTDIPGASQITCISRILKRNQVLQTVLPRILSEHREELTGTNWPWLAELLMRECEDMTPVYSLFVSTYLHLLGWTAGSNTSKRRRHRSGSPHPHG